MVQSVPTSAADFLIANKSALTAVPQRARQSEVSGLCT